MPDDVNSNRRKQMKRVTGSGTKSYATCEQSLCVICTKAYDTGTILLDRHLQDRFECNTVTGFGHPCKDCQKQLGEGSNKKVALVAIDPSRSGKHSTGGRPYPIGEGELVKPENAYRTGSIVFIAERMWPLIFNIPSPKTPMVFLEDAAVKVIEKQAKAYLVFFKARDEFLKTLPEGADEEAELKKFVDEYNDSIAANREEKPDDAETHEGD